MAQIFLSYQRRDRALVQGIDDALTEAGLTTWWDDDINPRENWDREIEREIDNAEFVLVLWTDNSVDSEWVRIEASAAKNFKPSKLIQVRFGDCTLPMAFILTQYIDLDANQPAQDPGWTKLLRWLNAPEQPGAEAPRRVVGAGSRLGDKAVANGPNKSRQRRSRTSGLEPTAGVAGRNATAEAEREADRPSYMAFLSYSHMDRVAAARLHRRLEAYTLPRRLAGTKTAAGRVPEQLWPIFRDETELPSSSDLGGAVREALAESRALIVLCSPHAAKSLWVDEEVQAFHRLHPGRPILAAVVDGDPPSCFPPALLALSREEGGPELLAVDLRPQSDGRVFGLLKLVAGVAGVPVDALIRRDAARRVRRIAAIAAVAVLAMLIMAALAMVALDAARDAQRQPSAARPAAGVR